MTPIPARPVIAPVPHHNRNYSIHKTQCHCEYCEGISHGIIETSGYIIMAIATILLFVGLFLDFGKGKKIGARMVYTGFFLMVLVVILAFIIPIVTHLANL